MVLGTSAVGDVEGAASELSAVPRPVRPIRRDRSSAFRTRLVEQDARVVTACDPGSYRREAEVLTIPEAGEVLCQAPKK